MMKDLLVRLEDRPGTLAGMGEILGNAGINIEGISAASYKEASAIHILVEDAAGARQALEARGVEVAAERDVLVLDINDRPGALGEIARKLADAGVNIQLVYLATKTRLVLGVDDLEKTRTVL